MKKLAWAIGGLVILIGGLFAWGVTALDYGDSVAVGIYRFERNAESSTLVLSPDHTFQQTLRRGSSEDHSAGTWRRVGEGGISFSRGFLAVSGDEPQPDGTTYSDMHKAFGVFTSLRLRQYHILWYGKRDSDKSPLGTYTGDEPGVISTLVLEADHSFHQTIAHGGTANQATGEWKQDPDGTIRFSKDFLKTSGEPLTPDETASAMDPESADLQIEVSMSEHIIQPVFNKLLKSR